MSRPPTFLVTPGASRPMLQVRDRQPVMLERQVRAGDHQAWGAAVALRRLGVTQESLIVYANLPVARDATRAMDSMLDTTRLIQPSEELAAIACEDPTTWRRRSAFAVLNRVLETAQESSRSRAPLVAVIHKPLAALLMQEVAASIPDAAIYGYDYADRGVLPGTLSENLN